MDETTRAERVWLLKNYIERTNEPDSNRPTLVDLRLAFLAAYLHDDPPDSAWETIRKAGSVDAGADFALSVNVGPEPLEWLGFNAESAPDMFTPEHPHADWRAGAGEPGYVTLRAVIKMLDHYADTGLIHWQPPTAKTASLRELCESYGIAWLAWLAAPQRGWTPPGAERTAIVRFSPDAAPNLELHQLEQRVSDITGCNVSLITPEQIWEERRQAELERAELVYAQADNRRGQSTWA